MMPDGAAWWMAQLGGGRAGARIRHGDPAARPWVATRASLELALHGHVVKLGRRGVCPGS
jgi:hypothetical protein